MTAILKRSRLCRTTLVFLLGIALNFFTQVGPVTALNSGQALDPSKVVGSESCMECHIATGQVWEGTHHFSTYRNMPRSDRAREIAEKLGIQRIKSESLCLNCHFTSQKNESGKIKPISGISCESCHGAGADWIKLHSDYGAGATRKTESPEHRAERLAASEKAGMIRPAHLFDVASNCYSCHTVPEEKLVNVGGHPAGSKFELVSWSQGEVRHNVWYTDGKENVMASPERKRVMYVTGQALDLVYALRGVAIATEEATYAKTMAKRAKVASLRMKKIAESVSIPEVDEILKIAEGADLKLNNEAALNKAADRVAAAARKFSESYDGSTLAGVDALIPTPDQYRGSPAV